MEKQGQTVLSAENLDELHKSHIKNTNVEGFASWQTNMVKTSLKSCSDIPSKITDFKQEIMGSMSFNSRIVLLGVSTFLLRGLARKFNQGILRDARNSVVIYGGLGVFLAPEIFNPFQLERLARRNN